MSLRPGSTVIKDPGASLLYTMDWSDWLVGGAQIASSAWAITYPTGETVATVGTLAMSDEDEDTTTAELILSDGTLGKTYRVTNTITTNETPAQTDERSFFVKIQQQ